MGEIEERCDREALRIAAMAQRMCAEEGCSRLCPEVFALAIVAKGPNTATKHIEATGGNLSGLASYCRHAMQERMKVFVMRPGAYYQISLDESCRVMRRHAEEYAVLYGASHVGVLHLLMGALRTNTGMLSAFASAGVPLSALEAMARGCSRSPQSQQHREVREHGDRVPAGGRQTQSKVDNVLTEFCTDLTALAVTGRLDPVVGRDREINRMITTLCRKKKNNPLLVGEQGTGKTAVVEGLAQRLASGNVPPLVAGRRILALNMTAMVAGTQYRGQFEERMENLLLSLRRHPDTILFIDEAHILVGAGGAIGAMDAGNILKPALARGDLTCIAATTENEYKKFFQKDKALDRRFQRVPVDEPTIVQTLEILRGLRTAYETHHHCQLSDEALAAAVELSGRHISDRFFPDKAIDAMDEACARFSGQGLLKREHIAKAIADQIGAPLTTVLSTDTQREHLVRESLTRQVFGQDPAIESVCRAVRRAFSPLRDPLRPLSSLVFGGPSSVGKSFVAQILREQLYESSPLIRLNMAEYTEKHNVSRLIGAPPGYIGHGDRNQLTDRVRRHPHAVVLFDNIDKAHRDVMQLVMEMLDTGCMTDGEGNEVSFRSTFIILTTTAGSAESAKSSLGFAATASASERELAVRKLTDACRTLFGDEFVNRVDEFLPFNALDKTALVRVATSAVDEVRKRLASSGIILRCDETVLQKLAANAANARAARAAVKNEIEPLLCDALKNGGMSIGLHWRDGRYKALSK